MMTEQKKSPNPFINMANTAKKNSAPGVGGKQVNVPKPTKGFGGGAPVRRSGRGR